MLLLDFLLVWGSCFGFNVCFLSLFHCGSFVIFEWVLLFHCGSFALFEWVYFPLGEFTSVWGRWRYCIFSFLIGGALFCVLSPCIINFVGEIFENKCVRNSKYNVIKSFTLSIKTSNSLHKLETEQNSQNGK